MNRPAFNQPHLKLTTYFGERQRAAQANGRPGFLADAMLDLFETHAVATSVMLRGIASFGPRHVLRTDESLSLSEDPPVAIAAVDVESKISALAGEVADMTGRGLITLERVGLVEGGDIAIGPGDAVKLTVYFGRQERVGGLPAHRAVCERLRHHEFYCGAVFLGVDGTANGDRYRAAFFSRNVNVPMMVVAVGPASQVSAAVRELSDLTPRALITVERIQVCKRGGVQLAKPPSLPSTDDRGRPLWQKLMVFSSSAATDGRAPIHRALVHRLLESGAAHGTTALRGMWGFVGNHQPHGDKLFSLTRRVPVVTIIVDTPQRIADSFDVVDTLTAEHGLVTCEMVPAVLTIDGQRRAGGTDLARHLY